MHVASTVAELCVDLLCWQLLDSFVLVRLHQCQVATSLIDGDLS